MKKIFLSILTVSTLITAVFSAECEDIEYFTISKVLNNGAAIQKYNI